MAPCCLSGGGRAYKLEVEIMKSSSPLSSSSTCWASRLSSSSSPTLSESSNSSSPVALSTRKPRTPRKRPNQTYNEAAALLSTAYPAIFTNPPPSKFAPPAFSGDDDDTFLLQYDERIPAALPCKLLAGGWEIRSNSPPIRFDYCQDYFQDGFDAGSILDGEIEEGGIGIDSIMGKLGGDDSAREGEWMGARATSYGFPIGMGFKAALKNVGGGDGGSGDYWWRFPRVNVVDITPKPEKSAPAPEKMMKKKKKKKKVEKPAGEFRVTQKEEKSSSSSAQRAALSKEDEPKSTLLLKLNYHSVLTDWMDRPSPFSDEPPFSEATGNDVQGRFMKSPNSPDDSEQG
ncbi:PREDICTED: protein CHLOROPLAST IMPORT APPARATUS 2-like isoform X2 [Ipomoea nil]|uniref:protein CHLOROPLAST IMPORT APPARATUS 2-like isoform X2 n=1 Tax=Ipomoea nil TaxID=35883 RepID=UPI00090154BF|nr:PREDICTED: protein CHLOROPLAST IMPORT APPARATUS 2-like isoform X2 [Ipomoea nil]